MTTAQTKVTLTIGDRSMTATLAENDATKTLIDILSAGPITIRMSEYGGFEKVGDLPQSLPAADARITTVSGDIMLYQGRSMVIFYGSNTWSYTPLGKIDGATDKNMREFLGKGSVTVIMTLAQSSAIGDIPADHESRDIVYDLNGNLITRRPLSPGIYIINGKKQLIQRI